MNRDRLTDGIDYGLLQQIARLSPAGQRWLKTAIQTVRTMPGFDEPDSDGFGSNAAFLPGLTFEPDVYVPPTRPRRRRRAAIPEPEPEPPAAPRRGGSLEDVITGRAGLREQLEAYPELSKELEGLGDVIEMLRGLGRERRKRGEQILREDILGEPPEDEEYADEDYAPEPQNGYGNRRTHADEDDDDGPLF